MPPVRRFLGAATAALVAVCAVAVPPPAAAQNANVTLQLVSQSPWVSGKHRGALDVVVAATNNGTDPVPKLELQVSFGEHISTQADFDAMLTTGVPSPPAGVSPLKTIHGAIEPGETRNVPITVDLPSHGRSEGAPLASLADMARWVGSVLDAAGAKQASLVGHSMGAAIALEAAALMPDRVTRIALLGTAAAIPADNSSADRVARLTAGRVKGPSRRQASYPEPDSP